ncbi:MAG TPA: dihydrolipoyl dehydrogenase [Rugosibacter sp.]|nr:dihydrolipoyl dehydrogenase [Rugosibacter sp.]HQN45822.1 dihydrolipoyl dehydrogenase [Rugosibacter sp.]HQQ36019.1 dihydrolipoyl dehydrogenase [Rugosibacter sp.]
MPQLVEVRVPDIGDFKDIPIIELLSKAGDTVQVEDALMTLESDKATLDVPSPVAGVIQEMKVKLGDKVSTGTLVATVMVSETASATVEQAAKVGVGETATKTVTASSASASAAPSAPTAPAPGAATITSTFAGKVDLICDLLVLGAGPGGYSAAFRAADLGLKTVLVERYSTLGGVCLNVGCIPSKALLHVAQVMDEATHASALGVEFAPPKVDIDRLRAHKAGVVSKLTTGLAGMAKARKVEVVRGLGRFLDAFHLEVATTMGSGQETSGETRVIQFKQCIIAAGSAAIQLPFLPDDKRIVDSTGALELPFTPKKMLVIGGGIIGLEMATVYATLGATVDVVEMQDALMQGPDRDLVTVWAKQNASRFGRIMLKTKTVSVESQTGSLVVTFSGEQAPKERQHYDFILQAAGRAPNGKKINAEKAGVTVTDRGFIPVDSQMRTNVPHIFAIGDIVGQPMLAHKAVHEAHVAAEVAAGMKSYFDASVIPSVAYTHPEVAWVGVGEDEAKAAGRQITAAKFPWAASGRAIANGAEYGFTKLVFDAETHRVIGGSIVGPNAGDMIGEVALAIEMGADAVDIGKTIHPHPTLGESIGMAAEVAHGSCTDLPPPRKR